MSNTGRRRLFLLRHGAVDYFAPRAPYRGRDDVPLTDLGEEQARAAGRALSATTIDRAFSSGLLRTVRTAELVLESAGGGVTVTDEPGLQELKAGAFDPSTLTPATLAARLAFSLDEADRPDARFLGDGEPFRDAYDRVSQALERLVLTHPWSTALVVAHEGVNRLALAWASGGGLAVAKSFEQDFARLTVFDIDVVDDEAGAPAIERVIIKTVNAPPAQAAALLDRRTSVETLFGVDPGAIRRPV